MERDELRALLTTLGIPLEAGAVLGIWPGAGEGALEVHLSPGTFWRAVKRGAPPVTSTEQRDLLFPHRHRFSRDGVDFITFSLEPVLPPGTLTPGFALRLT